MAREVETQKGHCDTHGTIEATREIPTITFPWVVNAVRRSMAKRQPFLCPECGEPIEAA
jgi:hypothetical protein